MTSTRLPGKVLQEVGGQPMLRQQIRRLRECQAVDEIVIATTVNADDDLIAELAKSEHLVCVRGDERDVLGRYVLAAKQARAEVVIRSTADCPLIDPEVTDAVINELMDHADECDYASNTIERTFPRGLDVEAFFFDTLLRLNRLGQSAAAREHVTVALHSEQPHLFLRRSVVSTENNADLRLTVDTEADLELVRRLYAELDLNARVVPYREIVAHLRANPVLIKINEGIETWSPPQRSHS